MKKPSAAHLDSAKKLLAREGLDATECVDAAGRMYEKISLQLSPLLGSTGVQALFARSLKQAQATHPCLGAGLASPAAAPAEPGDPAGFLRGCLDQEGPEAATEATVFLFATFFTLLATFIGDRLAAQVLQEAWPELIEPTPGERTKK